MDAASALRFKTGAKLNLFLRVVGRRPDGFHELESIFHSLAFADDLDVVASGTEVEVVVEGDEIPAGHLPELHDNLVYRAARLLKERAGVSAGARIELCKRIPIGGGLGGGSSNAAGTLLALDELWGLGLDKDELVRLGLEIGSDVPYCIAGGTTSLVTGRGENLSPLPLAESPFWFVLGISDLPLLTKDVYDEFDRDPSDDRASTAAMTMALGAGDAQELGALLFNALEVPAFRLRPDLIDRKRALLDAGALGAALSGSGPTLFGVAADESHARAIAAEVEDDFERAIVTASSTGCVCPA